MGDEAVEGREVGDEGAEDESIGVLRRRVVGGEVGDEEGRGNGWRNKNRMELEERRRMGPTWKKQIHLKP